jgi:signal transduction histidine kinase
MRNRYIGAILFSLILHLYFYQSKIIKEIDYKFYDVTSTLLNDTKDENSSYTVIIDIDEKSLQQLGQWPWPRVIDAKLIDAINSMNPSAIGINILFPEKDRTSPVAMQEFYKRFFNLSVNLNDFSEELKDNDKLLAKSIQQSGATLSTYFNDSLYTQAHCQNLLYKENLFGLLKPDLSTPSLLCNYSIIQKGIENFGFINASLDSDGIFRRIPLFVEYKSHIFPSFALATILSFDKYIKVEEKENSILINFSQKPKIISAIDILNGNVSPSDIQGKIAIIGSSIVGINSQYTLSTGEKISGNQIHASVIDNILNHSFIIEKKNSKDINLFISFLLSIIIILLLFNRLYIYLMLLFFSTIFISISFLISSYLEGIYLSLVYLWTPFLLFFSSILLYYMRAIDKEHQQQEKLLIKQSKLALMGEMISLIAHQWRQPLSAINGVVLNIDMDYRKEILDKDRLNEHLDEIEQRTAYLSNTINDFSNFFSTEKKIESFYISEVIRQTKKLISIPNNKKIEILYKEKEKIKVTGYKSELIQSLLILLNNAIYACQNNAQNNSGSQIYIDTYLFKDLLFISIEDTGGGIEKKNFKKIFNPYFTTKKKQHGTGLGLYILKLIIEESMGGKIYIQNGEHGAIFKIQIPQNLQ